MYLTRPNYRFQAETVRVPEEQKNIYHPCSQCT